MKCALVDLTLVLLGASVSGVAGDIWSESPDLSKVKPGFYGGDGTSQKQAVIAVGLYYSPKRFIAQKYPGSKILDVSLVVPPGKKRYDVYRVRKRDGKAVDVWFQLLGGLADLKPDWTQWA
jgi:hypothetical protein